jgi:hypothetical protein
MPQMPNAPSSGLIVFITSSLYFTRYQQPPGGNPERSVSPLLLIPTFLFCPHHSLEEIILRFSLKFQPRHGQSSLQLEDSPVDTISLPWQESKLPAQILHLH